ncbi:MAG: hypothetical protein ACFBSE_26400 [Prochloraceae cyanobacterium]
MKLEKKQQVTRRLLGYFLAEGDVAANESACCNIIDWEFCSDVLEYYTSCEESPQMTYIVGTEPVGKNRVPPKFSELGYIHVSVAPSFTLRLEGRNETELPEYIDVPVYVLCEKDWGISVVVELDEWISALDIPNDDEQRDIIRKQIFPLEIIDLSKTQRSLRRKLFGYVSATGGGIVLCEDNYIWSATQAFIEDKEHQIIGLAFDEGYPDYRAAVFFHIPEELEDRQFPVFGEYDGDFLTRIIVEIADFEQGEKVWNYNFPQESKETINNNRVG